MTNPAADVTLVVPAVPDSIAVIRQTVSGICEALGADARTVGDIKLAATEACTNVVLHAYAQRQRRHDRAGRVRDRGGAAVARARPRCRNDACADGRGPGLGLPLIAALTSTLTIVEPDEGGTEVSMTFALRDEPVRSVSEEEYRAAIACGPLLPRVLDRLLGALAAAPISRSTASTTSRSWATPSAPLRRESVANSRLQVIAKPREGGLALTFGPFVAGGAARVRRAGGLPGGGDLFSSVAKQVEVETDGEAELLTLQIGR